jgi:4'-phosphopantetheinyl transferase
MRDFSIPLVALAIPNPCCANLAGFYLVDLLQPDPVWQPLLEFLSDDERSRAARFHFDRDRRRFVVARAELRMLLAEQIGIAAREIRFAYAAHGKPSLAPEMKGDLEFNISHSHELAMIAMARRRRVGVDVEHLRKLDDMQGIARRFFSPAEQQAMFEYSPREQPEAFFRCWTRKEAYIKALGDGISRGLDTFDVSLDHPPRLLRDARDPDAPGRWEWGHLEPLPEYVAACVVERPQDRVT